MSAHAENSAARVDLGEGRASTGFATRGASGDLTLEIGFDSIARKRRVFDWLGAGLRPDQPGRLQLEYPLLFRRDPSVIHLTLHDGPVPVAFCSLWAVQFRVGVDRMRAGLVSFVYTDPEFRGRGHATRIVQAAIAHARELQLGLVLLWSDLDSLYTRLGFVRAGSESLLIIDRSIVDSALRASAPEDECADELEIGLPSPSDWGVIERLRGNRSCQLELDSGALAALRSVPDMSVRVARDANGVQAFAIRGRGDDFAEVIHEWGGRSDAVLRCCRALVNDCEPESELFLLAPRERTDVSWSLRRAGAAVVRKPLAWMRVACAPAFAEDLSRILAVPEGLELKATSADEDARVEFLLRSSRGESLLDAANLFALVFGGIPNPDSRRIEGRLGGVLDEASLDSLPLPFFVWGLESI